MRRFLYLVLLGWGVTVQPSSAQNHVYEEWVARYDGPGKGDDQPSALALDSEGNIWVMGSSNGGYATVKYSRRGEELSVSRHDQSAVGEGSVRALAVDGAGSIYVAVRLDGEIVTVKYNAQGEELWATRYSGLTRGDDSGIAIAVDGDCNTDGTLNLADALCVLGYLLLHEPAALPCGEGTQTDAANVALIDSNGDGRIDLSDPIYVLGYLLVGGPQPVLGTQCVMIAGCPDACGKAR